MTNDEKAEYYDEWHMYFEPLARVRREVVKALPNYDGYSSSLAFLIRTDIEVQAELDNLIQTMLNEVGDD